MKSIRADERTIRSIAVEADVDPMTVRRELRKPGEVSNMARERVRRVLRERGLLEDERAKDAD